jgi:hypothetical protein
MTSFNGALGIIHPPGVSGPFADCDRLYFTEAFLSQPPMWCEVALPPEEEAHAWLSTMSEWDDETHHLGIALGYEAIRRDSKDYRGWFLWPRGTRIVHEFPHHKRAVWLLTGLYFPLTTTTVYEGKWPD